MAHPHDRFFKFVFGRPERAAELLSLALPPELAPHLRITTLKPVKGTFIPPELRETQTDLLFEAHGDASLRSEPSFLLYLLFEHKSAPDPATLLQLLGYMTSIWHPYRVRSASRLPHVITVIVYHGRSDWDAPREFSDYFAGTPSTGRLDPQFRPLLVDVGRLARRRLLGLSAETQSALSALRYAASRSDRLLRSALLEEITQASAGQVRNYFRGLVTYLLEISTPEEEGAILKIVRTPVAREVIVTIAEKLRNEGLERGREEGRAKGRAEGTLGDRREVLIRQLSKKFGLTDEERRLIEATDDLDRLAAALDEILFAETKQQVLDELSS